MKEKKEKILFIGQNPTKFTGNGNMLYTCIEQVNRKKYDVYAMILGDSSIDMVREPFSGDYELPFNHFILNGNNLGAQYIVAFLKMHEVDQVIFVGFDIWKYAGIFGQIREIASAKKFLWKVLIPYDLPVFREDWMEWLAAPDQVFVYSRFGYGMLNNRLPNVEYFRPTPRYLNLLKPATPEEKAELRKTIFPDLDDNTKIIGFIGNNQIRKNILRMFKGVSDFGHKREQKDFIFYIHTDTIKGVYDIEQLTRDFDFDKDVVRHNKNFRTLYPEELIQVCKTFDAFLLPSLQEGLSWTIIEMGLLGIPCLFSKTTAHLDFIYNKYFVEKGIPAEKAGLFSIPMDETAQMMLPTPRGVHYMEMEAPSPKNISKALLDFFENLDEEYIPYETLSKNIREFFLNWASECHDISLLLESRPKKKITKVQIGKII